MGAIVGGLYSIGYTTDEMDSIFRHQNWIEILSDHLSRRSMTTSQKRIEDSYILSFQVAVDGKFTPPSGILAAQNVLGMLTELTFGYHGDSLDFNTLPIPFACVAFDMVSGKPIVFRQGNLPLAIRSSMSIPWAFEPVLLDSMVLVDGGVNNNFPVDVALDSMGATFIIGVDVSAPPQSAENVNSLTGMVSQLTEIIGYEKYKPNVERTDIYIRPKLEPYGTLSFTSEAIDSLINRGYTAAKERWSELIALKKRIGDVAPSPHKNTNDRRNHLDKIDIGSIRFVGLEHYSQKDVLSLLELDENSTISKQQLTEAIERLRGSGAFTSASYTANEEGARNNLTIFVEEKRGIRLDVGARFDTERLAAVLLNTELLLWGARGAQVGITTRLSDNPYLQLRLSSNSWLVGRLGFQYEIRYNDYRIYNTNQSLSESINIIQNSAQVYLSEPANRWFRYNVGIRYEYFHFADITQAALGESSGGYLNYFVSGGVNSLDDAYFPSRGVKGSASYTLYTDNGLQYRNSDPFHSIAYSLSTPLTSPTTRLTFIPSIEGRTLINGAIAPYPYRNHIGGYIASRYTRNQIDFVGSRNITETEPSVLTAQLGARVRLWENHFVSVSGGFGIENDYFFEMFNYATASSFWGVALRYAYRTPFGPVSLDVGYSTLSRWGVYLSIGKTF